MIRFLSLFFIATGITKYINSSSSSYSFSYNALLSHSL